MTSSFPLQTPDYILSFQFSAWYPTYRSLTIKSTIIRSLPSEFREYLDSDGVFVPEGSEDVPVESTLSDDEDDGVGTHEYHQKSDDEDVQRVFAFPELDAQIRACIKEYGAVFPKLNFSSPKDAAWILPTSAPLKCTSPSDVYLLLKSSDFVTHDLSKETVFSGCSDGCTTEGTAHDHPYELELVLRKWYVVDRSRELRCFVRDNILVAISQRDTNFYTFLNEAETRAKVLHSVKEFWETNIRDYWTEIKHYVVDVLLTRDLSRAHILDFNPYAPRTDPLLFTYEELHSLHTSNLQTLPHLKVIDSRSHPAANKNAPANQHNMVPFEALTLSSGQDIEAFAELWREEIKKTFDD